MIVEALEERVTALEEENAELKSNLACISDESDGYNVYFDGCNVHVRNAVGQTDSKNDRGNLILGYNEDHEGELNDRTGSHNLIIGSEHTYTSFGGLVAGFQNTISGEHASVSGGQGNTASGKESSVSGGWKNTAGVGPSPKIVDGNHVSGGVGCEIVSVYGWGVGDTDDATTGCVTTNLP